MPADRRIDCQTEWHPRSGAMHRVQLTVSRQAMATLQKTGTAPPFPRPFRRTLSRTAGRIGLYHLAGRILPLGIDLLRTVHRQLRASIHDHRLDHPSRPDSQLQPGVQGGGDRAGRAPAMESGLGRRRWQHGWQRRRPADACRRRPRTKGAGAAGKPRQGRGGPGRHHHGRGGRLHPRTDHGFGRPASGRSDSLLHACLAGPARDHGARQAGIRRRRPGASRQRAQGVEWLGQPGNPVDGHRRFAVRFPRLSDRPAEEDHARQPLDAPLRFRPGGGRPPLLGRRATGQHRRAGALFPSRRRRCFAFPLPARQHPVDLDAYAAFPRFSPSIAALVAAQFK